MMGSKNPSTLVEGLNCLLILPIVAAVADGDFQDLLLEFLGELVLGDAPAPVGADGGGLVHAVLIVQAQVSAESMAT